MRAELLHIYGPFSIHSYGLFIVFGLITFVQMVKRDPRFTKLGISDVWVHLVIVGAAIGLLGGRLLFVFTEQPSCSLYDMWAFWEGGFSVLGGVIAVTIFMPLYLYYLQIPIIPFADLIGIYAPLMLSVCRLGCFFAGCCYGTPTSCPWGVTYTDPTSFAPLCSRLHPTQLYSAVFLLTVFALLYGIARHHLKRPGQLICLFLFLQGLERFTVDFWRADRLLLTRCPALSLHQYLAIGIMTAALFCFILVTRYCKKRS
jgi:phosphatidylglycerol---prolipoprotein diacylglyceryl transferase